MKKDIKQKFLNPKVSIIIPVYNGSDYIKKAIDSALAQDYDNLEIIVVNDGSTDETEKICKSYEDKILYFKKENGGVSTALNLGISKMNGEYFSWLSHDDKYYPNKISKQIEYLNTYSKNEKIVLYSDYDVIDSQDKLLGHAIKDHEMLEKKVEYGLLRGSVNGITLLIPKSAFDECGVFDENLRCTQDYDLWKKMMSKYLFVHQPEILSCTRVHNSQDSVTSPKVIEEGNKLWISMIESVHDKRKIELENSIYRYYYEMVQFLKTTPYNEAMEHCQKKCESMINQSKKEATKKLVSVIIPFFNRSNIIKRAIDSVLNQTHENFEIILIDDASTENTDELDALVRMNDKIHIYHLEKNGGPAIARNYGIKHSKGEYIAFLDSDDEFKSNKLEYQLSQMILENSDFSHTSYVREMGKIDIMNSGKLNGAVQKTLICGCIIATPTVMLKKSLLQQNGIMYCTDFAIGEDVCFYLEIMKYTNQLLGIQEPLSIVHCNEQSAAYNNLKQLEGLSNIIQYILNDSLYKNFHVEISKLMVSYIKLVNLQYKICNPVDLPIESGVVVSEELERIYNSTSWKVTKPLRYIKNVFIRLKSKFRKV